MSVQTIPTVEEFTKNDAPMNVDYSVEDADIITGQRKNEFCSRRSIETRDGDNGHKYGFAIAGTWRHYRSGERITGAEMYRHMIEVSS